MLVTKAAAIGVSIFSRAALLLALSVSVYSSNTGSEIVAFFQLLFLQTVVISFLSASGFFRAQELSSPEEAASFFSTYLILALLSIIPLAGMLWFYTQYADYRLPLALVWAGGIFTAFSGALSGYLLITKGPKVTFGPSIIGAILFALVIVVIPGGMVGVRPYLVIVGYQAFVFCFLAVLARQVIVKSLRMMTVKGSLQNTLQIRDNIVIGVIHTFQMGLVFQFREYWSGTVSAELASAVFLVFRFSDTLIQFFHMVFSRHPFVTKLFSCCAAKAIWITAIWATVCGAGLIMLSGFSEIYPPLIFAIAAQFLLDLFRNVGSMSFLFQMKHFKLARYFWFVTLPPALSYALIVLWFGGGASVGLHLFFLINVAVNVIITLIQAQRMK